MSLMCNAVFEGGGVRGIGHVGAAFVMENAGYKFQNLAGSSAGAIVAALIAVGYSSAEIKNIMEDVDYTKFRQDSFWGKLGFIGKGMNLLKNYGIYNADYFEEWMHEMLSKKGKTTFGDIRIKNPTSEKNKYKLQVTASDVTDQRLLVFPRDFSKFEIDADRFSIAKAVRMSMSIPVFYTPYRLLDNDGIEHLIVDGGLLSNYPIWLLDDNKISHLYPTFGFKFYKENEDDCNDSSCQCKKNVFEYIKCIASTALDAHDNMHISKSKGDFERTIKIPIKISVNGKMKKIATTDFAIDKTDSLVLFNNGVNSAVQFLDKWDFEEWKLKYKK